MRIAPNIFSNQFTLLQNKHSCASSGENSKRWISGDTYVSGRRIVWRRRRETCDTAGFAGGEFAGGGGDKRRSGNRKLSVSGRMFLSLPPI